MKSTALPNFASISLALVMGVGMSATAHAAGSPLLGNWARGDGKARVVIQPCGDDLCAINTWIKPDTNDEHVGDKLVMAVKPVEPALWTGTAFDPQRNLNYNLTVDVQKQKMTTNGCVLGGLICKDMGWTRLDSVSQ